MDERLIPAIKHVQGMVNDERPQEEVLRALEGVLKMAHGERLSEKRVEWECPYSPTGKHEAFHRDSGIKRSVCRWCEEYFDHPQEPNPLAGATEDWSKILPDTALTDEMEVGRWMGKKWVITRCERARPGWEFIAPNDYFTHYRPLNPPAPPNGGTE